MSYKRLYRSANDRKIAGVCGGIAEYFDIDPVIVRVLALILILAAFSGFVAYIILWIVVPINPHEPEIIPPGKYKAKA
jgi:phage shock protein C